MRLRVNDCKLMTREYVFYILISIVEERESGLERNN
jgi:hypothetical protein